MIAIGRIHEGVHHRLGEIKVIFISAFVVGTTSPPRRFPYPIRFNMFQVS